MKKATMFTGYLAIWVTALFIVGVLFTYVNDWLQQSGFFRDAIVLPHKNEWNMLVTTDGIIDDGNYWGARHYWYYWLCIILFILSVARIAIWVNYYWSEKK